MDPDPGGTNILIPKTGSGIIEKWEYCAAQLAETREKRQRARETSRLQAYPG